MSYMKRFLRDRNEALLSLDKDKIEAFGKKYKVNMGIAQSERTFWGGVHRARLSIKGLPAEAHEVSRKWLEDHGFEVRGI